MLYQYATWQMPADGKLSDWREGRRFPVSPCVLNPMISEELSALLLQMIALAPSERPADYGALRARFERGVSEAAPRPSASMSQSRAAFKPRVAPPAGFEEGGRLRYLFVGVGVLLFALILMLFLQWIM